MDGQGRRGSTWTATGGPSTVEVAAPDVGATRRLVALVTVAALVLALLVAVPPLATASDEIVVTTSLDDDQLDPAETPGCPTDGATVCTLRAAVAAAEDGDVVTFEAGVHPRLSDGQGSVDIGGARSITILGNDEGGAPGTTISGGVPDVDDFNDRLIDTEAGADLTLENLVLTGGKVEASTARGGAVQSLGALTVRNGRFQDNRLDGVLVRGGAIYSQGTLVVEGSTFVGNRAVGATGAGTPSGSGGSIAAQDGEVTIVDSEFRANEAGLLGGAVLISGDAASSTFEITDTTFGGANSGDANLASSGGALATGVNEGAVTGVVTRSSFRGNQASNVGGAIYVERSDVDIEDTAIVENQAGRGGGINATFSRADVRSTITLSGSLLADNTATVDGGGLYVDTYDAVVVNSTVSGNSATAFGGGIYVVAVSTLGGSLALTHATIVGNEASGFAPPGGGLLLASPATAEISHTIIADNDGDDCVVSPGALSSSGYNLDGDGSCRAELSDPTDQSVDEVMLGDLADNGGPTFTHLPLEGSPAIEGGLNPTCLVDGDQRGQPRPAPESAACDIGAVEVQPVVEDEDDPEEPPEEPTPEPDPDDPDVPDDPGDPDAEEVPEVEEIEESEPAEPVVADPDFTG